MTHGFLIGLERRDDDFFLSLKAVGKLTHADYEKITPMLDGALGSVQSPVVYALFDIRELEGWELEAAWDDFKFGMKHRNDFQKIALVGHDAWEGKFSEIAGWFMAGEIKFFQDKGKALEWLGMAE